MLEINFRGQILVGLIDASNDSDRIFHFFPQGQNMLLHPETGNVILKGTKNVMPLVGLGTWKMPKDACADIVYDAIKMGYRLLDCAADYDNEKLVGEGLQRAMKDGIVTREEMFITSKLWLTFLEKDRVREGCERSLKDMGIDYFDLYLVHFPIALKYVDPEVRYPPGWAHDPEQSDSLVYSNACLKETWEGMEGLVDSHLAKNIGVANFNYNLIADLTKYAKIQPAVNQIEVHPYLQSEPLVAYCQSKDIHITGFHSFGGRSMAELGFELAKNTPDLFDHDTVLKVATKHKKTAGQILLRWALNRGIAVIPKSSNMERLQQNLDVSQFNLDAEDMKNLSELEQNVRFNNPGEFANTPIWS